EPDLTLPEKAQFAFYPDEGWVEAPALAHALLEAAARDGARLIYPAEVTALLLRSKRVAGVVTENGELEADLVVDCTGRAMGRLRGRRGGDEIMAGRQAPLLAPVRPDRLVTG